MGKGIGSRFVGLLRKGTKKGFTRLAGMILRRHSYPLFGVPSGLKQDSFIPKELYYPSEIDLRPPKTVDKVLFWRFREALERKGSSEGGGLFTLLNATATSLGGNLTHSGKLVTTYLKPVDGKPAHRHDLFRFSTKRFFPRIYRSDKPVITLAAGWQDAFYHWMYEVLPRMHLVEKAGYPLKNVYVAAQSKFQKESLALLGLQDDVIDAKTYDAITTPNLIIPSTPASPSPWGCRFLRESFLPKIDSLSQRRLYVSRRDADKRRVVNEEEIYQLLQKYNFERVDLSNLSFKKQIELFHAAEIVVGPHGAGFSHLVFCKPGTPFLEFFHPGYVNTCYWHLCNMIGHPYHYLFGEAERFPDYFDPNIDPDITLDLKKLEAIIKFML